MSELDDELFSESQNEVNLLQKQLGRILHYIHSDIFIKSPRGQVKTGDNITWQRHLELLNEADKARQLMDDIWDCGDNWQEWCMKD